MSGSKLKIADILNQEIVVTAFAQKTSKYATTHCLTIQFILGDETHVTFTGSAVLLDQCRAYAEQMPFLTTIKKIDKYYSFT